jgi:translation initiation factor IF-3
MAGLVVGVRWLLLGRRAVGTAAGRPLAWARGETTIAAAAGSGTDGDRPVRLVDETGRNVGVVPLADARAQAAARGLQLAEVSARTVPPVYRLVDRAWGTPKAPGTAPTAPPSPAAAAAASGTAAAAGSLHSTTSHNSGHHGGGNDVGDRKEIRLRAAISPHDLAVKVNKLSAFLTKGHRIKITLQYRHDEAGNPARLTALLQSVAEQLRQVGSIERDARPEGPRALALLMAPSKSKRARAASAVGPGPAPAAAPGRPAPRA